VTIEIKNQPGEANYQPLCTEAADKLLQLIHGSGIQERITVQSFDPTCLSYLHAQDSTIKTLYLTFGTALANLAVCVAEGFNYSSPDYSVPDFNAAYIAAAHQAGIKVNPYTVDSAADQKKLSELGVDGIISNYPACLMKQQGRSHGRRLLSTEAEPGAADVPACRPA
jgi:glycerophosphoryl diester phosphodiesterase